MRMLRYKLYKHKFLQPKLQFLKRYQPTTTTTKLQLQKKTECKFESDCPPKKRCVPQTTVCHTLPKPKCQVSDSVSKSEKKMETKSKESKISRLKVPPPQLNILPNEGSMSPVVKMAYRFLKFQAQAVIAGGSIYLTSKYGVWGDSNQTAQLYSNCHDTIAPLIKDSSKRVADVPDSRKIVAALKHYWNKGVIVSIATLIEFPATVSKWSKQLFDLAYSNLSTTLESGSNVK